MRPKILAIFVIFAVVAIAGMIFLKRAELQKSEAVEIDKGSNGTVPWMTARTTGSRAAQVPSAAAEALVAPAETQNAAVASNSRFTQPATTVPQRTASVQTRIEKLQQLSSETDPQALQLIVADLTNTTKAIRTAAREAAIQFGSRDAIPKLKEAAAMIEDPREKVAFLDAADFLELPTLDERIPRPGSNAPPQRIGGRPAKPRS